MENKQTASQLTFSLDLLPQVAKHIEFLEHVAEVQDLRNENILKHAAYRYENYWLPLAAEHPNECLAAPVDIEWIWLCHMLSPKQYESDCLALVGTVINHTFYSGQERQQLLQVSENHWLQMYGPNEEPFTMEPQSIGNENTADTTSSLSYDVVAAALRQESFYDKISSTEKRNGENQTSSLDRYKQFIYLCKLLPTLFFSPPIDVDLLWHTHQANPQAYKSDMCRILKRLLNHDDTSTSDKEFKEANALTGAHWEMLYREPCLAEMGTCGNRCRVMCTRCTVH
ncbi:uncharacterized protein LOC132732545 [Ruditapes philippinarum]|uniref:uncharacterized protein LOC132732545 n=1 Tax=Ruditapes philippinarum TaxID=129788 RepID=UPI00295A7561|nr:uncharacterized protein LOC132732545 [Ruditapes philippinarum]